MSNQPESVVTTRKAAVTLDDQAEQPPRLVHDKAIDASRRNRDLLVEVSRDVRVQLGSVAGPVQLLKQASLAPIDTADLDSINSRCDHLLGPVDESLLHARLERGPASAAQAPGVPPAGTQLEDRLTPYRNMATRCPLKILSADDNHVNRAMLQKMLELLGYQTDVVSNGEESVRAARSVAYDVILLDILMPHLDGVGATEIIRADADDGQQPYIVAVTANAMAGERERYLARGMDDYLTKPFDLCELAVVLEEAYGSRIRPGLPPQPGMLGAATAPLDLGTVQDRLGDAADALLEKVIPIFLRELPGRMTRLADALGRQDHADFGRVCHSLKGSSLSVGARQLADLCGTLQTQAESRQLPDTQTFAGLEELCHLTAPALIAKLDSLAAARAI